ncbi:MAG: hypothetical protein JO316_14860 [Abitibacteriaceae bacterium]|nr:hypothetical protein [Abditibacteriaceae bacterium]
MTPVKSRLVAPTAARRRGQSLIGLLAVAFILIVLYMMFLGPRVGQNGQSEHSVARQSIDRAKDVSLESNLSQIRMAISMYKNDNDGKVPASLDELKNSSYGRGFPPEMWVNPLDGKPLVYDPATGSISAQGSGPAPGTGAPNAPGAGAPAANPPGNAGSPGTVGPGGIKIPDMQPKVPDSGEAP